MTLSRYAPDTVVRPYEWVERAACASPNVDPSWWQAEPRSNEAANAVRICHRQCPVRRQCLAEAMKAEGCAPTKYRQGVAGGLLPDQRYALHRELRARQEASAA